MYVNSEGQKIDTSQCRWYNTMFNYDFSNKHIINFTHFQKCHHKLDILSLEEINVMTRLALDCTGVPNKWNTECTLTYNVNLLRAGSIML